MAVPNLSLLAPTKKVASKHREQNRKWKRATALSYTILLHWSPLMTFTLEMHASDITHAQRSEV